MGTTPFHDLGIRPVTGWLDKFWARVEKTDSCWNWIGRTRQAGTTHADPYGQVDVPVYSSRGPAWHVERIHRLAWELSNGRRIPEGQYVLHACDNYNCVRPEHLRIGTARDNSDDRQARGRWRSGNHKGHPPTYWKVTPEDVREIRAAHTGFRRGTPVRVLAERYGIGQAAIYDILTRKTWRHVP